MKKLFLILAAGLAGVILALLTIPKKDPSNLNLVEQTTPTSNQPQGLDSQGFDSQGFDSEEGEAGKAVVESADSRVEKSRQMAIDMNEAVSKELPDQWLRDWELTERSGAKMGSKELKGQPYIASFFYSTCPSICVRQNDQVRLLQEKFRKLPIKLVSITCDPENDTPEKLAEYSKRFEANQERWLFFTGDWDYLKRVSTEVFFHGLHRPKEHIEKFLLMSSEGKLIAAYDWHSAEELKILENDVRELLKDSK